MSTVLVLLGGILLQASANPYSVFVVHCKPKNADSDSFLKLRDMVAKASQHQVKLTIDFTPQWAQMILGNPVFLDLVTQWHESGHELGVHHHPYWVSQTRGTTWDGYTNTPREEISTSNATGYLGDMDDYLLLMNQLPGTRTSGTLGINHGQDVLDWPPALSYSAEGHDFDDIVGRPQVVEYSGHAVWQMNHGLFWNAASSQLATAYETAEPGDIMAVVTHVSNYEQSLANTLAVDNYFAFLGSKDPSGNSLVTVTQAMNMTVPEPATLSLLAMCMFTVGLRSRA